MYAEARDLLVKASQLHDQGYLAEAKTLYHQVLTLDPHTFEAKRLLGVVYRQMGDPTAAIACLEHIIREHEELKDEQKALVWTHLSTAYYDLSRHQDVVQASQKATELNPELGNAWNNLGASLKALGRSEEAIKAFQKALQISPGYARAMNNLAEAYQEAGKSREAERIYRQILEEQPEHVDAVQGLAPVLRSLGRQDEARELLEKSLEKNPQNVDLIRSLAGFKEWEMGPEQRAKLQELVDTPGFDPGRKETFLYLLAQDAEKRRDLENAATWYRKANEFKAGRVHYNPGTHENLVSKLEELFDTDFARRVRAFWPEPKGTADPEWQPVFVLGLPRSGTTLMNQILASHPEIGTVGELSKGFSQGMENLAAWQSYLKGEETAASIRSQLPSNRVRHQLASFYREAQKAAGATGGTVVDKLPGNFFYLPLIGMSMPRARIILTKRNLRDVALSCFQQNFAHGQAFSFDFERMKHFFDIYRRIVSLWREFFGERFMVCSYEDMVADFEGQAKKLVEFAGHAWSEKCLNFYESGSAVRTASVEQVRQPIYSDSVGKWKKYVEYYPELEEIPEEV